MSTNTNPQTCDAGTARGAATSRYRRVPNAGTESRPPTVRRPLRTASPARLGWRSPRGSPRTVRCRGALPGVSDGPSTSASNQHRTMSHHRRSGALTAGSALTVGDWKARLRAGDWGQCADRMIGVRSGSSERAERAFGRVNLGLAAVASGRASTVDRSGCRVPISVVVEAPDLTRHSGRSSARLAPQPRGHGCAGPPHSDRRVVTS